MKAEVSRTVPQCPACSDGTVTRLSRSYVVDGTVTRTVVLGEKEKSVPSKEAGR